MNEFDNFTSNDFPALYNAGLINTYSFDTTLEEKDKQFEFSITLLGLSLFLQAIGCEEIFVPGCLNDSKIEEVISKIVPISEL